MLISYGKNYYDVNISQQHSQEEPQQKCQGYLYENIGIPEYFCYNILNKDAYEKDMQ